MENSGCPLQRDPVRSQSKSTRRARLRLAATTIVLASSAAWFSSEARATVEVSITADNAYALGWGDADSVDTLLSSLVNTTSGQIVSCSAEGIENYTISGMTNTNYLYVAAWSDDWIKQGLLGQFKASPTLYAYTGSGDWQVCATGFDFDGTAPPLNGAPGSTSINAQIAVCNAGTGSPATTSAGWVGLSGGVAGNLAYGEDNTSGGVYDAIPCVDTAARWMWFNASPGTITDPFQSNPAGGAGHKEYLIFRLPASAILATCGDGNVDAGEQCDDGNAVEGDCCANNCMPTGCDDGNLCTTDSCDLLGACVHVPRSCDDLEACTIDSCVPGSGCSNQPVLCDDGNACTADSCDSEGGGACMNQPIPCFDEDICTADTCEPSIGCVFTPTTPCSQGGYERCQLAVIDATADLAVAEMKARARCEDAKLSDHLAAELDCTFDPATADAIASAEAKMESAVEGSCGNVAQYGWPATCPDFEGLGCGSIAIADAAGLASCASCVQRKASDQAVGLYYGFPNAPASQRALDKCQRTIGRATSGYYRSQIKALGRCYAGRITGVHDGACPVPGDGKSAATVRKAEAKMIGKISKACAALTPGEFGFGELCPAVGNCGGPILTAMDLIECLECVSTFKTGCVMNVTVLPRQTYPDQCLAAPGPCDDGLDCTLDELVQFTEESETTDVCYGGNRDGQACESDTECPGGECSGLPGGAGRACDGGSNDGSPCSSNADCPGGSCTLTNGACCVGNACVSGEIGEPCSNDADCGCEGPQLPVEDQCTHTPIFGDEFGNWRWICAGGDKVDYPCETNVDCTGGGTCINASPCCEDDSDCEYPEVTPDPCLEGTCAVATHRCVFKKLDESDCSEVNIAPYVPPPTTPPCVGAGAIGELCHLTAALDPPAAVNLTRFSRHPRPHFADLHVHMFAEESWVAKTWPIGTWRWVYDDVGTTTSSSDSCDGGIGHARVRTIQPILQKFTSCATGSFSDTEIGEYLVNAACSSITPWCPVVREALEEVGPLIMSEQMSKTEGTAGDTGFHLDRRHPGTGWPRWDTVAHHKVRADKLKKAGSRGLKLIVVMLTGTRGLCELIPPKDVGVPFTSSQVDLPFLADSCNEMDAVDRQIAAATAFAAAPANSSWIELVKTPEDAERVINDGKMAMVLSIETTELFRDLESTIRTATAANQPSQMDQAIRNKLRQYHTKGVSSLHIAHMTDSLFAGAAESDFAGQLLQFMHEPYGNDCHAENFGLKVRLGFNVKQEWDEPAKRTLFKNEVGLRPAGEILIDEMMNLGMLIDLSHCSEATIQRVWELAYAGLPPKAGRTNAGPYYPFLLSHARFREIVTPKEAIEYTAPGWVVQRLRRSGGMIGLRTNGDEMRTYNKPPVVENNCSGSSRSFAQLLRYGMEGLKAPISFGTDMMTLGQYPRPRYRDNGLPGKPRVNRNGACAAGFRAEGICQARVQENVGSIDEDFDTLGMASVNEVPDLIEDLRDVGVADAQLEKLSNSAEDLIRMWRRANSVRSGPAALANVGTGPEDMDMTGIGEYVPVKKRKKSPPYKLHIPCFRRYCEHTQKLGQECLFDGECEDDMLCGGMNLCGTDYGTCVCSRTSGCASTEWCKLGIPVMAFDNKCKVKKENGEGCHADRQCKSDRCSWFKCKAQ